MSEHILSLSYGKDSLACLGAIEALGWPLGNAGWGCAIEILGGDHDLFYHSSTDERRLKCPLQ